MAHDSEDRQDDPVFLSARKEAIVAVVAWLIAGIYTVGYCYGWGYDLDPQQTATMFGMPRWVVLGVIAPWIVSMGFGVWFSMFFIKDEDLGSVPEDKTDE